MSYRLTFAKSFYKPVIWLAVPSRTISSTKTSCAFKKKNYIFKNEISLQPSFALGLNIAGKPNAFFGNYSKMKYVHLGIKLYSKRSLRINIIVRINCHVFFNLFVENQQSLPDDDKLMVERPARITCSWELKYQ